MRKNLKNDVDPVTGEFQDDVLYEPVNEDNGIVIGERLYLRETVVGIIMSNNPADPMNSDNKLDHLIEHTEYKRVNEAQIIDTNYYHLIYGILILLIILVLIGLFCFVFSNLVESPNETEARVFSFMYLLIFIAITVFICFPNIYILAIIPIFMVCTVLYFCIAHSHHFTT